MRDGSTVALGGGDGRTSAVTVPDHVSIDTPS